MSKQRKKETMLARAAYFEYEALGPSRTLPQVLHLLGKSAGYTRVLEEWKHDFSWEERAAAHDDAVLRAQVERKDKEREEAKTRHAHTGRDMQARAVEQIKALIDAESFGSLAAVQLLKLAVEMERDGLDLSTTQKVKQEVTGAGGGPIIIETQWGGGALEDEE
jgi:hypothetical protein